MKKALKGICWIHTGPFPYYIGVCCHEPSFRRKMENLGIEPPEFIAENSNAMTHYGRSDKDNAFAIITVHPPRKAGGVAGMLRGADRSRSSARGPTHARNAVPLPRFRCGAGSVPSADDCFGGVELPQRNEYDEHPFAALIRESSSPRPIDRRGAAWYTGCPSRTGGKVA